MSNWQPGRDFVGYGATPPDPQWPNGARIALNFVMNYEEGSEASIFDGDETTDSNLTDAHGINQATRGRDLAAESMFEYGSRVGFWRLLRLFQERNLPMTIFACALAVERNPAAAQAIRESGFDICGHGWRWLRPQNLSAEEEREHIAKAIASLSKTVGQRPSGWYCRYGPSINTRRLLVEEGGFTYDFGFLCRRIALLGERRWPCAPRHPLFAGAQRRKVRCPDRDSEPMVRVRPRWLRHALQGKRPPSPDDVGWHAHALHGQPVARGRA